MRTAVLTVSNDVVQRRREDNVGPLLAELAEAAGMDVDTMEVVPSDFDLVEDRLLTYIDESFSLVLTAGGCGIGPEDFVPEVTRTATDRDIPGIGEALREQARAEGPEGLLFRGVGGVAGVTLIVNLPDDAAQARSLFGVLVPMLGPALNAIGRSREFDDRD